MPFSRYARVNGVAVYRLDTVPVAHITEKGRLLLTEENAAAGGTLMKRMGLHKYSVLNSRGNKKRVKHGDKKTRTVSTAVLGHDWVAATRVRNHVLQDPLIDYLKMYGSGRNNTSSAPFTRDETFGGFLSRQGIQFERQIVEHMRTLLPAEADLVTVADIYQARQVDAFERTKRLVRARKVPVLYQAVLHNHSNRTFGVVDLLVRNDYLPILFPKQEFPESKMTRHYVVVDIKFATLNTKVDNCHLLNENNVPFHKSQLCVYNEALATIQKRRPARAYILGRRFRDKARHRLWPTLHNDAFYRLGTVSFEGSDRSVTANTRDAVAWIKDLHANGDRWKLMPRPSRQELYPNMKRTAYSYGKTKWNLSGQLAEITSVWNCGIRRRKLAHAAGVYRWDDPACCAKLMGIGGKTGQIVDRMLALNRDTGNDVVTMQDTKLVRDHIPRKNRKCIELFLDFESISDIFFDVTVPRTSFVGSMLFMAGIGQVRSDGTWAYKPFYSKSLTKHDEEAMMASFFHFLEQFKTPLIIYHWGRIEATEIERVMRQYSIITPVDFELVDMCERVRLAQVVFKGAFGFGLKAIAKSLLEHGAIDRSTYWKQDGSIKDGMDAMVQLTRCYKLARDNGTFTDLQSLPVMGDMESYNDTDCRMVYEILNYLRCKVVK